MALAATRVQGRGSWMANKTPEEYARFLDQKAGHEFYEHALQLTQILGAGCTLLGVRSVPVALQQRWRAGGDRDAEFGCMLHDLAEANDIEGLQAVLRRCRSPQEAPENQEHNRDALAENSRIASLLIHPKGDTMRSATLGHWAVWYRHWDFLRCLTERCGDPLAWASVRGRGRGWVNGLTLHEFAGRLDAECGHPFYEHGVETLKIVPLHVAAAPPQRQAPAPDNQRGLCAVCLSEPASHMFPACRHLCVCRGCAPALQQCPMDRTPGVAVEVFMS
mmetsp:Transcript_1223/g.2719  ORF Transcript_1223/g.2719 Transcript_1223/m.2719 type:complete len:277 (+) Transcript_1223:606-1436(+)